MMSPRQAEQENFSLRAAKSAACAGFAVVCEKRDFADLGGEIMRGRGRENLARKFRNCLPISAFVPPHKFFFFCADCAARNFYSFPPAVPPAPRSGILKKVSIFLQPLAAPIRLRRLASKTRAKCAGIARPLRAEVRFRPKAPSFRPPVFRFSPTRNILRSRF